MISPGTLTQKALENRWDIWCMVYGTWEWGARAVRVACGVVSHRIGAELGPLTIQMYRYRRTVVAVTRKSPSTR